MPNPKHLQVHVQQNSPSLSNRTPRWSSKFDRKPVSPVLITLKKSKKVIMNFTRESSTIVAKMLEHMAWKWSNYFTKSQENGREPTKNHDDFQKKTQKARVWTTWIIRETSKQCDFWKHGGNINSFHQNKRGLQDIADMATCFTRKLIEHLDTK